MASHVFVLIGVAALHVVLFTGLTWWLLVALGGHATEAAFGTPALVKRRIRDTTVSVGPFPTGFVKMLGQSDEPVSDPRDWRRLGMARRVAIALVPWLVIFAIAILCLGPDRALRSVVHGVRQLLFAFDLTPLLRRFLALAAASPVRITLGVVFAKSIALNLMPLPGLAGGNLVMDVLGRRRTAWIVLGTLVTLYVSVRLVYAGVRVAIG